jgi:hypothetical protein
MPNISFIDRTGFSNTVAGLVVGVAGAGNCLACQRVVSQISQAIQVVIAITGGDAVRIGERSSSAQGVVTNAEGSCRTGNAVQAIGDVVMVLDRFLVCRRWKVSDGLFLADVVVEVVVDGTAVGITDALQPAVGVVGVAVTDIRIDSGRSAPFG